MTSIYSMISLVVLLLATYSYSAPVGIDSKTSTVETELQNSTIIASVENTTVDVENKHKRRGFFADFSSSEEYIPGMGVGRKVKYHVFRHVDTGLPHQSTGLGHTDTVFRQTRDPVEDETTVVDETTTIVESNTDNSQKREVETETNESEKREIETETAESEKREIETETAESEKREIETETEDSQKREVETETEDSQKREIETETEESEKRETETEEPEKRETETEESEKREIDDETGTFDMTTVEPTGQTEIQHSERKLQLESFETASEFNKRAIGSIQSVEPVESSTTDDVEQETTTIQSSSSSTVEFAKTTGLIGDKKSNTSESETTVEPIEETTTVSDVEMKNTTKIVAVIPGRIAQTKIVINSDKQIPVVVEQKQLSQGQN